MQHHMVMGPAQKHTTPHPHCPPLPQIKTPSSETISQHPVSQRHAQDLHSTAAAKWQGHAWKKAGIMNSLFAVNPGGTPCPAHWAGFCRHLQQWAAAGIYLVERSSSGLFSQSPLQDRWTFLEKRVSSIVTHLGTMGLHRLPPALAPSNSRTVSRNIVSSGLYQ